MWDRSKQNFWVAKQDWSVRDQQGRFVMNYPKNEFGMVLLEKVCFAKNDDEVITIIKDYEDGRE